MAPPCLQDTIRLCPLVPVGLVEACLEAKVDNGDKVSADCRKRIMNINDDTTKLMDACQSDVSRYCDQTTQTYAGERVKCLAVNREKLSAGCRKTFEKLSEK